MMYIAPVRIEADVKMSGNSKRILFVAECVTLAHMARPVVLAQSLAGTDMEVILAADTRYDDLFDKLPSARETIHSIDSQRFMRALAKGSPVYDRATLERYVEDDLALFDRVRPDAVVGDFRISLSVSARIAGVPYATISNIYWSPFARQHYPVPELPMNRLLGTNLSQVIFDLVRPMAFALHTLPMNRVRRHFGLAPLGRDLRRIYTDADLTLYADMPGLVATDPLPPEHRFIGPVLWSPEVALPAWWESIDDAKPIIYLTPGSSGDADRLGQLCQVLAELPATVLVASAGRWVPEKQLPGVFVADYLPGELAAQKADIVVCNGGSPTTAQALAAGVPVIGIPQNLDQYLNMSALERSGLGILLRSGGVTPDALRLAARRLLEEGDFRRRAQELQRSIAEMPSGRLFKEALEQLI